MRICGHRSMVCWLTLNRYNDHNRVLRLRRLFYAIFGFSPERIETSEKEESKVKYIVHKRFKDKAICGDVNLPALTECESHDGFITCGGKTICCETSENAHQFFSRNDDGMGMVRGFLTQAIQKTLSKRDKNYQERWDRVWDDEVSQSIGVPTMKISGCGTIISLMPTLMTCGISLN